MIDLELAVTNLRIILNVKVEVRLIITDEHLPEATTFM